METKTKRPEDVKLNAKVVEVIALDNYNDRVIIKLDKEFSSFDENGNAVQTNQFGINARNLQKMLSVIEPNVQLANALAMGKQIKEAIFSLVLANAEVSITRKFKFENEKREGAKDDSDVYRRDTWTTQIDKVITHILPNFVASLQALISNPVKPVTEPEFSPFSVG